MLMFHMVHPRWSKAETRLVSIGELFDVAVGIVVVMVRISIFAGNVERLHKSLSQSRYVAYNKQHRTRDLSGRRQLECEVDHVTVGQEDSQRVLGSRRPVGAAGGGTGSSGVVDRTFSMGEFC